MSCIYSTNSPFLVRHRYKIPTEHSVASVWGAQGLELFFRADDSNVWSLLLYFTKILLLLASCLRHCLPQNQQHYLPDNKAWIIPRRDTIAHAEWDLPELVILWSWKVCCWMLSNSYLSLYCPAQTLNSETTTVRQANVICLLVEGAEDVF